MSSTTPSGALMTFFIYSSLSQRRLDRFLGPVLGPSKGLLPARVEPFSLLLVHLRLVAAPEPPAVLELLAILPEPGRQPREVRRAQSRGLEGLRNLDRDAEDVGLELHHPPVCRGATVGSEGGDGRPRVRLHRLDHVAGLVAHTLERRPCQVRPCAAARQADDGAPGVRVPVRRPEAHERRDEVHVVVGVEARGELLRLLGVLYDAEAVTEPLHRRAGYEDGPLERVLGRLVAEAPGNGSEQLALALYGFGASVHESEGARAVCVLRQALLEGHLAEEGGLLVACDARDRDLGAEDLGVGVPIDKGARLDLRQHLARHTSEHLEQLVVPLEVEDVVHEGTRGVRVVGDVLAAASQLVDEPGVHGAQSHLTVLGPLLEPLHVVQEPGDLRTGEVGVDDEACLVGDHLVVALLTKLAAEGRASPVLPDDGVVDRLAGLPIPNDDGLALVGDPDRRYVLRRRPGVIERLPHDRQGDLPDLVGVVLDPAGPGIMLRELLLGLSHRRAVVVENYGSARRGPLIYRQYVVPCHAFPFPSFIPPRTVLCSDLSRA